MKILQGLIQEGDQVKVSLDPQGEFLFETLK